MLQQAVALLVAIISLNSASQLQSVEEASVSYWVGTASDNSTFVLEMNKAGKLSFMPTTGVISRGMWRQHGNVIEMELNKSFVKLSATLEGNRMHGNALTKRGAVWTWTATKQPYVVATAPPEYPPLARAARVTGSVLVDVDIDSMGQVTSVHFVRGHPLVREGFQK